MNEIQAGRSALLAPVRSEEFDLSVARDRQILGITANTFYVDPGADGSAYRGATATLWIDDSPLTIGAGFLLRKQTSNVRLTNAAQSGKRLRLVYGQDVAVTSWFTSSGISLNQPSSILPAGVNLFYGLSPFNTSQVIFTFTANDNQAIYLLDGQIRCHTGQKTTQANYASVTGAAVSQSAEASKQWVTEPFFYVTADVGPFYPNVAISKANISYAINQDVVAPNDFYIVTEQNVDLRPQVFRSVSSHNRQVGFWPGTYVGGLNSFSTATASYQIFPFTG